MIKSISIAKDQSIELNSSMGWLYVYQEQFGHDVLVVVLPAIEAGIDAVFEIMQTSDPKALASRQLGDVIKGLDKGTFTDALITLSGMQLTTFVNVAWAMAKNANDETPDPKSWANSFEVFPVDIILPEVFKMLVSSCISKKNRTKLSKITKTIKKSPSESSKSQSPESTEG